MRARRKVARRHSARRGAAVEAPARVGLHWPFDTAFPIAYAVLYAVLGLVMQLQFFQVGDLDLETDFFGELVIGAEKLRGGSFAVANYPFKGPVYSIALLAVQLVMRDWYRSAVVLNTLCTAGFLILAYRFLLRLYGRKVAFLSTVFSSLVLELFLQSHRACSDILFLFLTLASMYCFVLGKSFWRRYAVGGALAGVAFLTRYNGIFLVAGALLALVLAPPVGEAATTAHPTRLQHDMPARRRLQAAAAYCGAFLLVCTPWFIGSYAQTGHLLASKNMQNIMPVFYGGPRWQDHPITKVTSVNELVRYDPRYFAVRFLGNVWQHFRNDMRLLVQFPGALLVLVGLLALPFVSPTRAQRSYYLYGLAFAVSMGIVFYASRFDLPLVLPYGAIAFAPWFEDRGSRPHSRVGASVAAALVPVWGAVRDKHRFARLGQRALVVGALGLFGLQISRIAAEEERIYVRRPLFLRRAGQAMRIEAARAGGRHKIMARKGHIAYLSGLEYQPYPANPATFYDDLLQYAWAQNVDYIAYSVVEALLLPRLQFMASADSLPRLRQVYRSNGIRIFEVDRTNRAPLSQIDRYALLRASLLSAESKNDPVLLFLACDALATFHSDRKELQPAAEYLQRGLEIAQRDNHNEQLQHLGATARHNLARLLLLMGRPAEAIPLAETNIAYFERGGTGNDMARARELLGSLQEGLGRKEEAAHQFRLAYDLYIQSGNTRAAAEIRPWLQ